MKYFIRLTFFFAFSLNIQLHAQDLSIEKGLKADFKMANDWLNAMHPFAQKNKISLEISKNQKLSQPDSLWKILAKSLKKLSCGHTFAYLPDFSERKNAQLLAGNFFINANDTTLIWKESKDERCYRMNSIDNIPVKKIIGEILTVAKAAPLDWKDAEEKFALYYALLFSSKKTTFNYEIFVSNESNQKQIIQVSAIKYALWLQNYETRYKKEMSLSYILEYKTAFLRVPNFFVESSAFNTQMPFLIQEWDSLGIEKLVIDLRQNQGGSLLAAETLFSYLCADTVFVEKKSDLKSLRIFDHLHLSQISARPYSVPLQHKVENYLAKNFVGNETKFYQNKDGYYGSGSFYPAKTIFKGKISVLVSSSTFSAAEHFCRLMFLSKRAKFIGTATGGSAKNLQADIVLTYTLPNSQISIEIPLIHSEYPQFNFSAFQPDIKTKDYQEACDEIDEAILKAVSW